MAQSQHRGQSDLSEKASEMKDKAIDRVRETGAGEVAGNVKGAVDKSVNHQRERRPDVPAEFKQHASSTTNKRRGLDLREQ